jgi:hypothetical protein
MRWTSGAFQSRMMAVVVAVAVAVAAQLFFPAAEGQKI